MSNEVMTRNSEWMNHIVNHLNRMVDNFERAVMNYRPMLDGERFMTDKELCARLQLSRRTLQDYRNNGVIPYIQLGGKILYRESDIQKILMANYREAYRMKGLVGEIHVLDEWGEMNKATTYNLPSVAVIGCRLVLLAIPSWSCLPGIICVTCINLIPC